MSTTIWADFSHFPGDENAAATAEYIKYHWGLTLGSYTEEDKKIPARELENKSTNLGIIVRDYPEVIEEIIKSGHFSKKNSCWIVSRISEQGVTLYTVNHRQPPILTGNLNIAEAIVFIPMSNVISIYIVPERFFVNESIRIIEEAEK
jgi:hypothetical protein